MDVYFVQCFIDVAGLISQHLEMHVRRKLGLHHGHLGLDPLDPQWTSTSDAGLTGVVDSLVALALEQRTAARARKDWAAADAVRDQLKQAGVVVEDTPAGPRWTLSSSEGN